MNLPELYSALADPTRLKVLDMLHEKSRPVHELAAAFDISRPAISRHLRVLKEAGLVKEVKQGRENVYTFQREPLKAGANWIEKHASKPVRAKKAAKAKVEAVEVVAPVPAPAPIPAPEPKQKAIVRAKPVAAAKPAPAPKPKVVAPPVAAPALAPQLSFFDL
jgi:DNA-binding transcriptional ArsR family regulator